MKTTIRWISLLLVLALLPAWGAAEISSRNILSDDPLGSLAVHQGQLYAMAYRNLYRVDIGIGSLTLLTPETTGEDVPALERIFGDDEGLLGFDPGAAALYRIDVSAMPATAQLLRTVEDWTEYYMMDMAYRAPYLYAYGGNKVHRLNVQTGDWQALDAGNVSCIAAYKDGLLLAIESERAADGWTSSLFTYDFDAGKKALLAQPQGTLGNTLAYDATRDTVYTANNRVIYAWTAGDQSTTHIAPIPKGDSYALTVLDDQAAVITDGDFLAIRPLAAGAYQAGTLTLLAPIGRAGDYRSFYQQHPETDLVILGNEGFATPEERFIQDMLTQSADIDVYLLSDQNLLHSIKEKQFALPLDGSPVLAAWASKLEQPFYDAIALDGHVYALPQEVFLNIPVYNKEAFEQLNLTVPATYEEYYDFSLMWVNTLAQEHTDYRFDPLDNGMDLTGVLARIAAELERNDQPLDFTAPAIRNVVDKVAQVGKLQVDTGWDAPQWLTYQYYLPALVDKADYLLLRLHKDNALALPVGADDFRYLVINPYSKNTQAALQLLEGVAQRMEGYIGIVMDKTMDKALENPEFQQMLAAFDGRGEQLRSAIAAAQGAEKRNLEEALKAFEADREAFISMNQYLFDAEAVARARQLAPSACIPAFNPIWQLARQYPDMFEEYRTNPHFDVDQFLTRLNGMVATALAERQ